MAGKRYKRQEKQWATRRALIAKMHDGPRKMTFEAIGNYFGITRQCAGVLYRKHIQQTAAKEAK